MEGPVSYRCRDQLNGNLAGKVRFAGLAAIKPLLWLKNALIGEVLIILEMPVSVQAKGFSATAACASP